MKKNTIKIRATAKKDLSSCLHTGADFGCSHSRDSSLRLRSMLIATICLSPLLCGRVRHEAYEMHACPHCYVAEHATYRIKRVFIPTIIVRLGIGVRVINRFIVRVINRFIVRVINRFIGSSKS
jgi:hypothetical protein